MRDGFAKIGANYGSDAGDVWESDGADGGFNGEGGEGVGKSDYAVWENVSAESLECGDAFVSAGGGVGGDFVLGF